MKYTVYQIRYTEDEIAGINAGTKSMKREIRDNMAMDFRGEKMVDLVEKALYENFYTAVSFIEAACLDEVFHQNGQIKPPYETIFPFFSKLDAAQFRKLNESAKLSFLNQ